MLGRRRLSRTLLREAPPYPASPPSTSPYPRLRRALRLEAPGQSAGGAESEQPLPGRWARSSPESTLVQFLPNSWEFH